MKKSEIEAFKIAFRAQVVLFFNAFSALALTAKGYRDGIFKDWPSQAFDVGVNVHGWIVGAMPGGRDNARAGAELRKEATDAGAVAANPVSCGPAGNVSRTRAHFLAILSDPTFETTARIEKGHEYASAMAIEVNKHITRLRCEITEIEQMRNMIVTAVNEWEDDNGRGELHFGAFTLPLTALSEVTVAAFDLEAPAPATETGVDWDAFLVEEVGMDRGAIIAVVEEAAHEACAYLEARKHNKIGESIAPVVNTRKLA